MNPDDRNNKVCPHPGCFRGAIDTGGVTPWGAAIKDVCPVCNGDAFVSAQTHDEIMAAVDQAQAALRGETI